MFTIIKQVGETNWFFVKPKRVTSIDPKNYFWTTDATLIPRSQGWADQQYWDKVAEQVGGVAYNLQELEFPDWDPHWLSLSYINKWIEHTNISEIMDAIFELPHTDPKFYEKLYNLQMETTRRERAFRRWKEAC